MKLRITRHPHDANVGRLDHIPEWRRALDAFLEDQLHWSLRWDGHVRGLILSPARQNVLRFHCRRHSGRQVVHIYHARITFGKTESRSPVSAILEDDNVPHFNLIGPPARAHLHLRLHNATAGQVR
jgi:hypothetical protein